MLKDKSCTLDLLYSEHNGFSFHQKVEHQVHHIKT